MTLADLIAQKVAEAISQALKDSEGELTDIAKAGGREASGGLLGDVQKITDIVSNILGDIPLVQDVLNIVGGPVEQLENAGGKMGRSFGFGYLIGYFLWQLFQPGLLPLLHDSAAVFTNEIYDPQTAAQLAAKGIIDPQFAASEASGGGYDQEHISGLIDAMQVRPALSEVLQLLNRGLIKDADAELALERDGVPQFWRGVLLQLRHSLLSPADLALATLRGDIQEDEAKALAAEVGTSTDQFDILMGNTGEPPGIMQLLEMYRREFIDEPRLVRGIKQSRARDEWIPYIEKLRYAPMSVADAVDALVQNHLTYDEAKAKAIQDGLEPGDFDTLYKTAGQPISRTEAMELWKRGQMTQAEVEQAIRESHIKDKYIPYILELGRRLIPYRTLNTIVAHGVRPKEWGIEYLVKLGYTHDDASALMGTTTSTKVAQTKHITETMALDLYEARSISLDQAIGLLGEIGYDRQEAEYLLKVTDARATLTEQNHAIGAIRTAYVDGKITFAEASNDLDSVGVLADHRDKLLKDWRVEKRGRVRVLTPSEVANAHKYKLWTWDQAITKLVDMGYSHDDAVIFLGVELHGLPPGVTAPPPKKTV